MQATNLWDVIYIQFGSPYQMYRPSSFNIVVTYIYTIRAHILNGFNEATLNISLQCS